MLQKKTNLRPRNPSLQSRRQSPHNPNRPKTSLAIFTNNLLPFRNYRFTVLDVDLVRSIRPCPCSNNDPVISARFPASEDDLGADICESDVYEASGCIESCGVEVC